MIFLCGSGYIGSAFKAEMDRRDLGFYQVSRSCYTNPLVFSNAIKALNPKLVINAAAYIPPESVSLCDQNQAETIRANVMLPAMLAQVCQQHGVPFAHISTGCLWNDGLEHSEDDPPQRAFNGHCGFYVGTKVLAEEVVRNNCEKHYIWRVRLPFDEIDHPRNYLSKLARFNEVYRHENTISHRGDFAKACLDLWQMQAEWGTYNVMNPGSIRASEIVLKLMAAGLMKQPFMTDGPQCDCKVSVKKLLDAGVVIRPVEEALDEAIRNWRKA